MNEVNKALNADLIEIGQCAYIDPSMVSAMYLRDGCLVIRFAGMGLAEFRKSELHESFEQTCKNIYEEQKARSEGIENSAKPFSSVDFIREQRKRLGVSEDFEAFFQARETCKHRGPIKITVDGPTGSGKGLIADRLITLGDRAGFKVKAEVHEGKADVVTWSAEKESA